jgi:hypothetical protein
MTGASRLSDMDPENLSCRVHVNFERWIKQNQTLIVAGAILRDAAGNKQVERCKKEPTNATALP